MTIPVAAQPIQLRRGKFVVAACTLAVFGPYVVAGFRTEQIVVYGTLAALVFVAAWLRIRPTGAGVLVAMLLAVLLSVGAIGAAVPPPNTSRFMFGSALAGLDNLILPLAVLAIVWMLVGAGVDQLVLVRTASTVVVWGMVINAGLAMAAVGGNGPDLAIFQGPGDGESVAYRAEQLGRYSGIFNQPAEAGVLYSVALLAVAFLYRQHAVLLALTGTMVTVGGILTVSKVFLLIGLPIGLWQVLRASGGRQRRFAALIGVALAIWATARSGLIPEWLGADYVLRLLPGGGQDSLGLYTAGRLGETSTLTVLTDAVLDTSPVWGYGAGGLQAPYDNAWVEALVIGGLVGAVAYTTILVVLSVRWIRGRAVTEAYESRLAGGLVAVVIGASLGVPALTANRCSTILWLLLGLLLLTRPCSSRASTAVMVPCESVATSSIR